jgi:hypothetical protein
VLVFCWCCRGCCCCTSDSSEDANGLSKDQRQRKRKSEKIVKGVDLAVRIAKAIRPQASETTASAKKTEAARQVLLQREADLAVQQALHTKHATIRDNIAACGQDDPEWKAAMTAKLKAWTARLLDDDECDDVARIREEADEEEEVLVPVVVVIDVVEWSISLLAVMARTATTSMVDVKVTSEAVLASVVWFVIKIRRSSGRPRLPLAQTERRPANASGMQCLGNVISLLLGV